MAKNILPELVSISRNCRLTNQLEVILSDKLDDSDLEILHRWLQIVQEEKTISKNRLRNFRNF
jgi:hypothetical protein